jgi:hypothetical protein
MDPGSGSRDRSPGWQAHHHQCGMENRGQAMAAEKWLHQNRDGRESVTPFKSKIVP